MAKIDDIEVDADLIKELKVAKLQREKERSIRIIWKDDVENDDYPAAKEYLDLLYKKKRVKKWRWQMVKTMDYMMRMESHRNL